MVKNKSPYLTDNIRKVLIPISVSILSALNISARIPEIRSAI